MTQPPLADRVARSLAAALLAGDWTEDALTRRAGEAVGKRFRFLRPFVRRALAAFPQPPALDPLAAFAAADPGLAANCRKNAVEVRRRFVPLARMTPHPAAAAWPVPPLPSTQSLADWLGIDPPLLAWYADVSGRNTHEPAGKLRHYTHVWADKGGGRSRLLEAPKSDLKRLQRKLLDGLLAHVPPHPAAHGFVPGRSVVTNAAPHCGRLVVVKFDLADFFPSVSAARVNAVFRTAGYPPDVARLLTGLCTVRTPADVWDARPRPAADGSDRGTWLRLSAPHLPQGAPTSPALANLAAFALDRRLSGLAAAVGATYTRYADDLTFSGGAELRAAVGSVRRAVADIAAAEGFAVNPRKTRVQPRGVRQKVTGVVVNVRPNLPRVEFDMLKATLTNCVRRGPAGENRARVPDFRAHLAGRVAHAAMLNPARGRKLWALFDRIDWRPAAPPVP